MAHETPSSQAYSNTELFSPENLTKLKSISYENNVAAGTYLYREGDIANKLYYIIKGQVRITKSTDDGQQLILYMFQNNDLFGQLDSLQASTHSFNAEVMENSVIGTISSVILKFSYGNMGTYPWNS